MLDALLDGTLSCYATSRGGGMCAQMPGPALPCTHMHVYRALCCPGGSVTTAAAPFALLVEPPSQQHELHGRGGLRRGAGGCLLKVLVPDVGFKRFKVFYHRSDMRVMVSRLLTPALAGCSQFAATSHT